MIWEGTTDWSAKLAAWTNFRESMRCARLEKFRFRRPNVSCHLRYFPSRKGCRCEAWRFDLLCQQFGLARKRSSTSGQLDESTGARLRLDCWHRVATSIVEKDVSMHAYVIHIELSNAIRTASRLREELCSRQLSPVRRIAYRIKLIWVMQKVRSLTTRLHRRG